MFKRNESTTSYATLCQYLNLTFDEARAIYDKVWNIPLSSIGKLKETHCARFVKEYDSTPQKSETPLLRSKNIVLIPTGVDWRHLT